eukprot:m51a1_g1674 hypothetical protein (205) ;mRNA; f:394952-395728
MALDQKKPMVSLADLQAAIKDRLSKRGGTGIHALGVNFKNWDDDGNKKLNKEELSKALAEMGIPVNKTELAAIMQYYDRDGDGNISFDEFLVGLKSEISPRRQALVEKAFRILDKDTSGNITIDEIVSRYDASRSPEVLAGRATARQVLEDFLGSFEGYLGSGNHDKIVTFKEFCDYYTGISSSIDDDEYFVLMMCSAWHIAEK